MKTLGATGPQGSTGVVGETGTTGPCAKFDVELKSIIVDWEL